MSSLDEPEPAAREQALLRRRRSMESLWILALIGMAGYAVCMRILSDHPFDAGFISVVTAVILLATVGLAVVWTRGSGLPAETFGLTWQGALGHARQAVLWTLPALGLLTAAKWGLCRWSPSLAGRPVFVASPQLDGWLAILLYSIFIVLQEFVARGTLQGALFEFLSGSPRARWIKAILVSNTLFAVTHLHFSVAYAAAAFLGGLLWAALFAAQRSLAGPIVSHLVLALYGFGLLGMSSVLLGTSP